MSAPASPLARSLVQVEEVKSFQLALSMVRDSSLRCADLGACPSFVGMFLAADKQGGFSPGSDSVAACTAVLVGEDLALTNSHCLPSAVKLLPDLCSERVRVVFPESGSHPEESFACSSLVGYSERTTAMSPDLALLRLDRKTTRQYPELNRKGVANGSTLGSFKVNPNLKELTGVLRKENCTSVARSYRMPIYEDAASPAIVLGDCMAISGNSGGALLDEQGRLMGLMQANLPISENARRDWGAYLANPELGIATLAMGTSLICLNAAPPAWSWNEQCTEVTEQHVAFARPRIREQLGSEVLESQVAKLLEPYLSQTKLLRWKRKELETRPLHRRETLVPFCLAPLDQWHSEFLSEPKGNILQDHHVLNLELPQFSFELRFNKYLQSTPTIAVLNAAEKVSYEFSPKTAGERGQALLTPESDGAEPLELRACE